MVQIVLHTCYQYIFKPALYHGYMTTDHTFLCSAMTVHSADMIFVCVIVRMAVLALGSQFKGGNPPIPNILRGIFKIWAGVRDHEYTNLAKILPFLKFKQLYYFTALTILTVWHQ